MIFELPPIDPSTQQPGYEYDIDLSGVTYRLRLYWRERTQRWYLDLADAGGAPLFLGVQLVIDFALGIKHRGRRPEDGFLALVDVEGTGEPCTYEDLGRRCRLCWVTSDEIPEAESPYQVVVTEAP